MLRRSYRRPESGGPKPRIDGRSLRDVENERDMRHARGESTSSVGPGHYEAPYSREKTQFRRTQQPVVANYRARHTERAECVSVTLMTGHHWRERIPRLGEAAVPYSKDSGIKPTWQPSTQAPPKRQIRTSHEAAQFRRHQVSLSLAGHTSTLRATRELKQQMSHLSVLLRAGGCGCPAVQAKTNHQRIPRIASHRCSLSTVAYSWKHLDPQ